MKIVSGRIVVTTIARERDRAAAVSAVAHSPSAMPSFAPAAGASRCAARVLLDSGRCGGLRARQELADDPAGRQEQRILVARVVDRRRYSATLKRALPSGK
jgi:hypothetical protein